MQNYSLIRNLLESIFSVDVGLDENGARAALGRVLNDERQRAKIESELHRLFSDQSVVWMELLDNDSYVVYPADDEDDAKNYMVEILWDRVFPNTPAP
ncbi:hypothetical protein TUM18999_38550 [Pseudomonas tohonis]|uniref:Uncharacterized protein n=1 Tax=Pseudomonas tohonis TaxID=2725477 RepID=A0A6J4E9J4_9PSED|nr:hypothetical protein [Pseudomonas tohonis]BCG25664.1 hypothetical protein TUM18999_38550 [Pseudomonas tohonis]GJN56161.1 hypothetical protein TUM20286_59130 [Pseudomonas tohonis]